MNRIALPINEIVISNRQRLDLGDIQELADSISRYGLIQPIVINQEKRLIAGGRRVAACVSLGHKTIDVVYRETLTEDELHELELEENVRRKDMTWQEKCLNIATIHQLKTHRAALDSASWGQRQTGEMLNISSTHINYCLIIANCLQMDRDENGKPKADSKFWQCESLADAWRQWLYLVECDRLAELAKRQQEMANSTENEATTELDKLTALVDSVSESPDLLAAERERYYSNPHNEPGSFESYWAEKQAKVNEHKNTVYISNRLINADSIEFMRSHPDTYEHIITDIPYGIDIEMLDQQVGIQNIDTIKELHDVDYNKKLIVDFFPAAYSCTKVGAFVVTWCDQMLWQFMFDCATAAGFKVQRWPITWNKTHSCLNQCANFNTTKDTEIAIVCRKRGATLAKQPNTSVISANRDELCDAIAHPFAKPFAIWEFLINAFTYEGQLILEPFSGRGSGVISMLKLRRNVVGIELDKDHYNALLENVKNYYRTLNPNFTFK